MDVTQNGFKAWIVEGFYHFFDMLVANVLWVLVSLPVVTAPAAAAGLYFMTNQLAHDRPVSWRTFFEGFRKYFKISWVWAFLNLVILAILISNLVFYDRFEGTVYFWIRALFFALLLFWLLVQNFTFPMLIEQTEPHLMVAMRNSLGLFLANPKYAFGVSALILILSLATTRFIWPAWLLVTGGVNAYLANRTVGYIVGQAWKHRNPSA